MENAIRASKEAKRSAFEQDEQPNILGMLDEIVEAAVKGTQDSVKEPATTETTSNPATAAASVNIENQIPVSVEGRQLSPPERNASGVFANKEEESRGIYDDPSGDGNRLPEPISPLANNPRAIRNDTQSSPLPEDFLAVPPSPSSRRAVKLRFSICNDTNKMYFTSRADRTVMKALRKFSERIGSPIDVLRFTFEGVRVRGDMTLGEIGMEDGQDNVISAFREAIGGDSPNEL